MAFSTFSGPVLVGTVRATTGSTSGTVRNTGTVSLSQNVAVSFTDITANTAAFAVPAGSLITSARFLTTAPYATTTPAIALFSNGVAINTASNITAAGSTGYADLALGNNNAAGAALVGNVGAADALITFTQSNVTATSGAGVLVLTYVTRNVNGSSYPTSGY